MKMENWESPPDFSPLETSGNEVCFECKRYDKSTIKSIEKTPSRTVAAVTDYGGGDLKKWRKKMWKIVAAVAAATSAKVVDLLGSSYGGMAVDSRRRRKTKSRRRGCLADF
ncbi:hypothetical protein Fot_21945 [Forsythia ovata]|uniref:Uncharacterized protein n=1 Tax=Forsythia ovata TaxID=205694 RepID=A0ABD1UWA9_9LAMI